ncbi:uncharacterized protein LOC143450383 [Clavelina lepadiformis]|uniref:uncharacterized protein LOC143450383 n=1 Tax=Clavelina lepadiformis TaxID=159417 RepID=UPI00404255FC
MVEMPALSQGILANNSITPDVEIKACQNVPVREKLLVIKEKQEAKKASSTKPEITHKEVCFERPYLTGPPKSSSSHNSALLLEVAKLSEKVESLAKNSKLQNKTLAEQRTLELEKKLTEVTDERLNYLEKLQQDQEKWKAQYLKTIERLNEPVQPAKIATGKNSLRPYPVCKESTTPITMPAEKESLLVTPLPRKEPPKPTSSMQPGNGQFLKDILDQCSASTPNLAQSSKADLRQQSLSQIPIKSNLFGSGLQPSPILHKPTSSQAVAKQNENDLERRQIAEKFPCSFTDYLPVSNATPVSRTLTKTVPQSSLVEEFRGKLQKLVEMRSNLENNLATVQRKQKVSNFAVAALANQMKDNDLALCDDDTLKKYWIEKIVDEEISANLEKVKQEVADEIKNKKSNKPKKPGTFVKKPEPKCGGSTSKQDKKVKTKTKQHLSKTRARFATDVKTKDEYQNADESLATHVYGKADYHPHRTTVHQPFMHVSPIKSPKFRTKRALQAIPAHYVRSEKSQTSSSPVAVHGRFLAPTAISLGPPRIHEGEPDPLVIPPAKPTVVVSSTKKPAQKKRQETPEPKEKRIEIISPDEDLPGNFTALDSRELGKVDVAGDEVLLDGEGGKKPPPVNAPPPPPPKPSPPKIDLNSLMKQRSDEEQMKRWVEQEIMAQVLQQLFPEAAEQEAQTPDFDADHIKDMVEEELRRKVEEHLRNRQTPKTPEEDVEEIIPETPIPTPSSTPTQSIHEDPSTVSIHVMKTPSMSPQSSITESPKSEATSLRTPSIESEHEITLIPTPAATPVASSPEVSIKDESIVDSVKESSVSSRESLPDPWEGKSPDEDLHLHKQHHPDLISAPEPTPTEIVVRTVTPPPGPKVVYSPTSSESSSSETRTDDKTISEGQLLVEHGEMIPKKKQPLMVPHELEDYVNQQTLRDANEIDFDPTSEGEFRPQLHPPYVPKKSSNYVVDDPAGVYSRPRKPLNASNSEDLSVGEVPLEKKEKFRRWRASRRSPTSSPPQAAGRVDATLSVGDLEDSSLASSSHSLGIAPDVIMVTSATPRPAPRSLHFDPSNDRLEATQSDILLKDSLDDPLPRPRNQMTLTLPSTDPASMASDTDDISVHEI